MTTRRLGLLPHIILLEVILEKFKGSAGMTTRRSGLLPEIIFAGGHF